MTLSDRYEKHREGQRLRDAEESQAGRDIAEDMPAVVDPARKARGGDSLEYFSRTYYPLLFRWAWASEHRKVIGKLEAAARLGGCFAYAMPRSFGKTTLAEMAATWSALYGYRRFSFLFGKNDDKAVEMLDSIKMQLETNDLLHEDFPEVCHAVRRLEAIPNRCKGQRFKGQRTYMQWGSNRIVLPMIPGSAASSAVIQVAGMQGSFRGAKYQRPDGVAVRPEFVILDDPIDDDDARSPAIVAKLERVIKHGVLGLAGNGKKIAAVMPCTVIAPGDLADKFTNPAKYPTWQGERSKMLRSPPKDEAKWDRYKEIRDDSIRAGNNGKEATEFYRANREAMDAGAEPAWPDQMNEDEISAIQHAMNLKLDDPVVFAAEHQNEPLSEQVSEEFLSADEIAAKTNGISRGAVPIGTNHLTAYIDVQGKMLYWLVAGWGDHFTGNIIDYGSFPDQKRSYYTLNDAKQTLAKKSPKAGMEGCIYAGLEALVNDLAGRAWKRADGIEMRISKCLIDANWGNSTNTVYQFCRQSMHAAILFPSHGKGIGAKDSPMDQYIRKVGEHYGFHWYMPTMKGKRAVRHVVIDTNHWKTFVHYRLQVCMGDKGCLALFGKKPDEHRMFGDHLTAEFGTKTQGRGRELIEWKPKPGKPDNHFFDCLSGAACAASMLGVSLNVAPPKAKVVAPGRPRRRVFYADELG